MRHLERFLKSNGISQRSFAGVLNVDPSIVSRLTAEVMRPSLELAVKIERATNGAVPAAYWVDVAPTQASVNGNVPMQADLDKKLGAA